MTGEKADPSQFFEALSEASSFCAELDSVRELQCRIQELEAELHEWKVAATERLRRDNAMLRKQAGES